MHVTTMSRYGVRALFDVAYFGGGGPTRIKDISARQGISMKYLEKIFHKLRKAGLLNSRRGPRGGYMLAREPSEITMRDIVSAADGPLVPVPVKCLSENGSQPKDCQYSDRCVSRHVWTETQRLLHDYYDSISLADLCDLARGQGVSPEVGHDEAHYG